ncbi:MAG: helix-turn-helix domain-containing protein [Thermoguttaceae bacterium]|jgi:excisionase family DNA binding protein
MSEYYTLEKAAEVLGKAPGDLNRLREAGKIRAFRDGSAWKFRKDDIDNYLAQEIREKSGSSSFDDEGLLTDESDEEEKPTMMADTNLFGKLDLEITANTDDDGVVAVDDDSDGIFLGTGGDDRRASSSSIALGDDDDDDDDFASGISILDDPSDLAGSSIDLTSDSGISIEDSGLPLGDLPSLRDDGSSGISILGEENLQPAPIAEESMGDDFDFELNPIPSETTPAPSPSVSAQEDDDIFDLQPTMDEIGDAADAGDTYGVAGESSASETKELDLDDDFELEPIGESQDSESESSSQMLDLDLGALGGLPEADVTSDAPDGGPISLEKETTATAGFGLGPSDGSDPFAMGGGDEAFSPAGGFGDMPGVDDFSQPSPGDATGWQAGSFDVMPEGEDLPEPQGKPIDFNGLGVGLGLIPCIILMILAGIGVWELVRTMWSWDHSFSLTGPVLEMVGGLLKLF